jgi:hypothetical protein
MSKQDGLETRYFMEEHSPGRFQIGCNEPRVHLLSVLLVIGIIQIIEFLLLEVKYDIFSGGFLQPYAYLSWGERTAFVGLSLWMDLLLFGGAGIIWYRCRSRLGTRPLVAAYFFVFFCLSSMGFWLTLKYEILSYFNDTINFLIIKNLGGGSFSTALSYLANETSIYGLAILALFIIFLIGLKLVRRVACTEFKRNPSRQFFLRPVMITIIVCLTIVISYLVNSDLNLRHGLNKKTSFWIVSNLFDQATDLDRDGYGLFAFPQDPEPFNPSIYPGALDIPGNGVDENGYGGDFDWSGYDYDPLAQLPPQAGSNIILILLESTRSDLLQKQINGKVVAPKIRKLAREGSTIDYAYSHTGYTVPSLTAIFNRSLSSKSKRKPLTDYLEESGYSLSFISGEDESFGDGASKIGMDRPGRYLFDARSAINDRVYPSKNSASLRLSEERVIQAFKDRASQTDWSQPQFFYVNLQAAHFPYSHPGMPQLLVKEPIPRSEINEENRKWLEATYWNAVAVADNAVGDIVTHLEKLGVYEQTLIVIVGDHGESLFDDHFLGHGHALNDVQTHIPLIFNKPNINIHSAVGQIDIADLIVQLATNRFNQGQWDAPEKIVPQIVGSWKHPQLIGTVSYGGSRTILDHRTRRVFFSDLRRWTTFDSAWDDPDLGPRTRKLINILEKVQWENHNAAMQNPPK